MDPQRSPALTVDHPVRIVVADDLPANLDLMERILCGDGHIVYRASNGSEALALVEQTSPDLVLLDVMMPDQTGFDVCMTLKSNPATRLIPVVLVTALNDSPDKIRGLDAGADDFITKPVNRAELRARVRSLVRLKRHTDDLESAEATIFSLALTIEARDPCTEGHCQRLATYATSFAEVLGLPEPDREALRRGGILHDIGKVGLPDSVLLKPGPLTPDEVRIMRQHTVIGDRLCASLRSLTRVRGIVRHHHERIDGSGYPDGLAGDAVPLLAQMIGIVDVFDALTTERPYKAALGINEAIRQLDHEVARGWHGRDLVRTFVSMVRQHGLAVAV
jgi:putative two-component system response regulator